MDTMPMWLNVLFGALATIGFAIFFDVRGILLIYDGLVGGISWLSYLVSIQYVDNPTISSFIAASIVSICAEILARRLKQPALMISVPGILPLIPGISLYNTIYLIIQKKYTLAANTGTNAVLASIGIALGILLISSLSRVFNIYKLKRAFINNDTLKYVDWVNLGKNRTGAKFAINKKEMNEQLNSMNIDFTKDKSSNTSDNKSSKDDLIIAGDIESIISEIEPEIYNENDQLNK